MGKGKKRGRPKKKKTIDAQNDISTEPAENVPKTKLGKRAKGASENDNSNSKKGNSNSKTDNDNSEGAKKGNSNSKKGSGSSSHKVGIPTDVLLSKRSLSTISRWLAACARVYHHAKTLPELDSDRHQGVRGNQRGWHDEGRCLAHAR